MWRGRSSLRTPTGSSASTSGTRHRRPGAARPGRSTCSSASWRARYRGEIHELTGRVVASPIDECRPGTRATFTSACRLRRRRSRRSSPPGAASCPLPASGWPQPAITRWPGSPRRSGCGCGSCAGCGWRTCTSVTARSARSTCGWGRAREGRGRGADGADARRLPDPADLVGARGPRQFRDDWELPRCASCSPPSAAGRLAGTPSRSALGQAAGRHLPARSPSSPRTCSAMRARPGCMARASAWRRSSSCWGIAGC